MLSGLHHLDSKVSLIAVRLPLNYNIAQKASGHAALGTMQGSSSILHSPSALPLARAGRQAQPAVPSGSQGLRAGETSHCPARSPTEYMEWELERQTD